MSVLSVVLGFICSRLWRKVVLAVNCADILSGSSLSLVGDTQTVGSHVGDKTNSAYSLNVNTFVKFLRSLHGTLCREAELLGSLLLQGGCDERRCRLFLGDTLLHIGYGIFRILQTLQKSVCFCLIWYFQLFSVNSYQCRIEYLSR